MRFDRDYGNRHRAIGVMNLVKPRFHYLMTLLELVMLKGYGKIGMNRRILCLGVF